MVRKYWNRQLNQRAPNPLMDQVGTDGAKVTKDWGVRGVSRGVRAPRGGEGWWD